MSYSIPIKLSKDFIMKVHAHPLLADIKGLSVNDPFYQTMWEKTPETIQFNFGGWNGNQFKSHYEAKDFRIAFTNLLERSHIDASHEGPLLYISAFQYQDSEKQSKENYNFNYYKASGGFLLELYINGCEHFDQMKKDPKYYAVADESTREVFFSLLDPKKHTHIEDHYGPGGIHYQSFNIGKSVIRIPNSFQLSIFNSNVKNREPHIDIPSTFKREILTNTLNRIIKEHEEKGTEYMEIFNQESHDIRQLKTIVIQNRKSISEDVTLIKIGSVIQDYLKSNYNSLTKSAIADFLWEYFSLLKAYKLKNNPVPPSDYSELTSYYISHNITKLSIKHKFKDTSITGYF